MASEIIRDGKTYKVGYTFEIKDGKFTGGGHKGGEISESDVDSIIEADKLDAELLKQEQQFAKDDADFEADQLINTKSKSKSKSKKGII